MTSPTTVVRRQRGVILTRRFGVPRELVFRMLSEPEHLMRWWGPPSCPVVDCTVDFRPGGVWHYRLRSTDGSEHWARSVYREIVPPERISYVENPSDEHGAITHERPAAYVILTLDALDDGTLFTADVRYASTTDRDRAIRRGIEQGFSAALDQLESLLLEKETPDPRPGSSRTRGAR